MREIARPHFPEQGKGNSDDNDDDVKNHVKRIHFLTLIT